MSRSTTYRGLHKTAKDFLKNNAVIRPHEFKNAYGPCTVMKPVSKEIGTCGMFDECPLLEYELKDGTFAREYVQASPWAGGPIIFIGLETETEDFVWPDEEIEKF